MENCPLCFTAETSAYARDRRREYRRCVRCELIFVPASQRLRREEELAHYHTHENNPADPRYRAFLSPAFDAVVARVAPPARGLDYGSGPAPTLSVMLEEAGYTMSIYDPFFAQNDAVFAYKYDFITCTEVIEHVFDPGRVIPQLLDMLERQGFLVIMTQQLPAQRSFVDWYYKNDPTHVCFYSAATFAWIAMKYALEMSVAAAHVVVLRKKIPLVTGA